MYNSLNAQRRVKSQHLRHQLHQLQQAENLRKQLIANTAARKSPIHQHCSEVPFDNHQQQHVMLQPVKMPHVTHGHGMVPPSVPSTALKDAAVAPLQDSPSISLMSGVGRSSSGVSLSNARHRVSSSSPSRNSAKQTTVTTIGNELLFDDKTILDSSSYLTATTLNSSPLATLRTEWVDSRSQSASTNNVESLQWVDMYGLSEGKEDYMIDTSRTALKELDQWLSMGKRRATTAFILSGRTGIGKTAHARAALCRHGYDVYIVSSANIKHHGSISNALKEIATRDPLFDRPSAVIVDDVDGLAVTMDKAAEGMALTPAVSQNQSMITNSSSNNSNNSNTAGGDTVTIEDVAATLRSLSPCRTHPIIFTCTDMSDARVRAIRDVCQHGRLQPPATDVISQLGWKIVQERGQSAISTMRIENLAHCCNGDVRQFLSMLQMECTRRSAATTTHVSHMACPTASSSYVMNMVADTFPMDARIGNSANVNEPTLSSSSVLSHLPAIKECSYDVFKATRDVIMGEDVTAALRVVESYFLTETFMFASMVHHNWLSLYTHSAAAAANTTLPSVSRPRTVSTASSVAAMADMLSVADMLETPPYTSGGASGGHETMVEYQQHVVVRKLHLHRPHKSVTYHDRRWQHPEQNHHNIQFSNLPKLLKDHRIQTQRNMSLYRKLAVLQRHQHVGGSNNHGPTTLSASTAATIHGALIERKDDDHTAGDQRVDGIAYAHDIDGTEDAYSMHDDADDDHCDVGCVRNGAVSSSRMDEYDSTLYMRLQFEHAWNNNPEPLVQLCIDQQLTPSDMDHIPRLFPSEVAKSVTATVTALKRRVSVQSTGSNNGQPVITKTVTKKRLMTAQRKRKRSDRDDDTYDNTLPKFHEQSTSTPFRKGTTQTILPKAAVASSSTHSKKLHGTRDNTNTHKIPPGKRMKHV